MLTILGQTDKLMLKWMMGNEEIGLYTAAYNCAGVLAFVFVAIIDSFRPAILESNKTDSGLFAENMKSLYSVLIYLSAAGLRWLYNLFQVNYFYFVWFSLCFSK